MSTTENRSMGPTLLGGATDWASVLGTAIVITPLAAGAAIGRTACAPRAFFHPDCTVGPGVGLRLHRVMRRRALAGYTADQGVTPLPRRPPKDYQFAQRPSTGCWTGSWSPTTTLTRCTWLLQTPWAFHGADSGCTFPAPSVARQ